MWTRVAELFLTAADVDPDGETRSEAARKLDGLGGVVATLRSMHGTS